MSSGVVIFDTVSICLLVKEMEERPEQQIGLDLPTQYTHPTEVELSLGGCALLVFLSLRNSLEVPQEPFDLRVSQDALVSLQKSLWGQGLDQTL